MTTELIRTCGAPRKGGGRCQSTAVGEDGFCGMHSPERRMDPAELGRVGGRRSGEVRREQAKSVRDRLREKVEEEFEAVWSAFSDGMQSDETRDRVTAVVALLAEAYGRPPQAIVGDANAPLQFEIVSAFGRRPEEES